MIKEEEKKNRFKFLTKKSSKGVSLASVGFPEFELAFISNLITTSQILMHIYFVFYKHEFEKDPCAKP